MRRKTKAAYKLPSRDELSVAIIGTVGVPGRYGGFETLAENLVRYHAQTGKDGSITIWCSAKDNEEHPDVFMNADLRYLGLRANGAQSILYDMVSIWEAVYTSHKQILLLGVSGALFLPVIRLVFHQVRIVTNVDGIEWKREKWSWLAKKILRLSEWSAVRFSHAVIADNQGVAQHIHEAYGKTCEVIAYGGDHAICTKSNAQDLAFLPPKYAFSLCRIEPENNVHMVLEAFNSLGEPLVFIGNWDRTAYGRNLKKRYDCRLNIYLLDPIYEPEELYAVRRRASVYVHGHSAGGTNPSLVEMMHFGIPILAHDCIFNRYSTEGKAQYFKTASELEALHSRLDRADAVEMGRQMQEIAKRRYTWDLIGESYFKLLNRG